MIDVYLEVGSKRTIAAVVEWPGWCRIGRDEASALEALLAYGERYGQIAHDAQLRFKVPTATNEFNVVEQLKGSSMTDFGALEAISALDQAPLDAEWLHRARALLQASWRAFDAAVAAAQGIALQTGPRGGGRDLDHIVEHVIGVDASHLSRLGYKYQADEQATLEQQLAQLRAAILDALDAAAQGTIATRGPRGGKRIPARFFVRRALWHVLDHVWEIEDRAGADKDSDKNADRNADKNSGKA